jgi:outer membrane protein TolC
MRSRIERGSDTAVPIGWFIVCFIMAWLACPATAAAGAPAGEAAAAAALPPPQPSSLQDFHAGPPQLGHLIEILLEENPEIRAARAGHESSRQRAAQRRALPDPQLQVRYFASTPETRVGPQEAGVGIQQAFPWFGKRRLEAERAGHQARSIGWSASALARDRVAELKRAYFEAAYYQEAMELNREEKDLLERFEKIALTRYGTGQGIQGSVVKVQTEITRLSDRHTQLHNGWDVAVQRIGRLLGRAGAPPSLDPIELRLVPIREEAEQLAASAATRRPEIRAAQEWIESEATWARRQALGGRPDFRLGLEWIAVDGREDRLGRATPPEDNGQDVVALVAGISLPVFRGRIRAGVSEAQASLRASRELLDHERDRVRFEVEEARLRVAAVEERARFHQEVLLPQAREALALAEAAYITNRVGFLDLLDAERVLFQSRLTLQRLLTDFWIAAADLERALGRPFPGEEVTS